MSTLKQHVEDWINEQNEEGYTEALPDLLQNGCQSGMVSELIYYSDTIKFYNEHKEEINALLAELVEGTGTQPAELFSGWDENDPLALDTTNQNLLAWFGFEETASRLA